MKNILIFVIAFLSGIATYWLIARSEKGDNVSESHNIETTLFSPEKASVYYQKLTKPINDSVADELLTNYLHRSGITDAEKDHETEYIWLSMGEMQKFIRLFRDSLNATGIRIYPGVYPKNHTRPDQGQPTVVGVGDLGSKLTLFFVPTREEAGSNYPVDITDAKNARGQEVLPGYFTGTPFENETTQCPPPKCPKTGAKVLDRQFTSDGKKLIHSPSY